MSTIKGLFDKFTVNFWAVLFEAALIFLGLAFLDAGFIGKDSKSDGTMIIYAACTALAALVTGIMAVKFYQFSENHEINRFYVSLLLAVNSMILPEIVMNANFMKSSILYNILGFVLCCVFYFVFSVLLNNSKLLKVFYCIASGFFAVYAVMQFYVTKFRGNPIQFADFANLRSCFEIKSEYKLSPEFMPVYAVINLSFIIFFIIKCPLGPLKIKPRIIGSVLAAALCAVLYFGGNFAFNMGIKNRFITLNFSGSENLETYERVGFDLMLYFDGIYNHVSVPNNYSDEKGEEILARYNTENPKKRPVIIAIMNESFADFEHIGSFKTNKDYMPNYHKLKNESVTGYVTVSAYGGYSCNSEYEFLTGNTLGFLPSGSAVFTQYLDSKQDGLVSYLNDIGYSTIALSPCSEGLWNIGGAYKNLQFGTKIYNCENNIYKPEKINGNLSDESLYRLIENKYKNMNGKPFFLWTATMQNHGPYDKDKKSGTVPAEIKIDGYNGYEPEQYLNSIYQSDKALGELTDYFRNVDDEVIIVMFGDHFPHIMDFTEHLYGSGVSTLSVEDYARLHQTPFIIWSNKGLKPQEIDQISLNYLSNEVMKAADIPLAPYQQELERIRKDMPVISQFGYMNSDSQWFYINDNDPKTADIKNEYHIMQYYRMFKATPHN